MNHLKKIIAVLMCGAVLSAPMAVMNAEAATFEQVNKDEVFVNQNTYVTCTLASNVMMLRRAAILLGDPNWMKITEDKCHYLWMGGMVFDYTFAGTTRQIEVINRRVDELEHSGTREGIKRYFIDTLKKHPEGVVYYDYDIPHAILLTDYDADTDTFFCSDPNIGTPTKRVPLSHSNVNLYNYHYSSVWFIKSPELHFTSGSTATSTSRISTVNETWQVTDDAGLNLRENAGTGYDRIGYVPDGTVLTVTKKKVSGGYTWGYVRYDSKNGWIALDYATRIEEKQQPVLEDTHSVFENKSFLGADTIMLGEKITVKGKAEKGTAPYTYAYYYKRASSSNWTTIQDFSSLDMVSVEPMASTDYDVCVKIRDAKGNVEKKYMTFEVKKPLVNKSGVVSDIVYLGEDVTFKCKAAGGIGSYSYDCFYKRHEDESWVRVKANAGGTVSFKPMKATIYDICVKVSDEKGHLTKYYDTVKVCPKLVNDSRISADHVRQGESVKLTAAAHGGESGYQYAYYCRSEDSTGWKTIRDFSHCTTAVFTASRATTYDVCVKVKDFYGRVEKKYFKVYVRK